MILFSLKQANKNESSRTVKQKLFPGINQAQALALTKTGERLATKLMQHKVTIKHLIEMSRGIKRLHKTRSLSNGSYGKTIMALDRKFYCFAFCHCSG